MPSAIIIGCNGQDGRLLYALLDEQGYDLVGIDMNVVKTNSSLSLPDRFDICNRDDVDALLQIFPSTEIYHLAAFHHSSEEQHSDFRSVWENSYQVNTLSLLNFLEGVRQFSLESKVFYASSAHVFGAVDTYPQDEYTPIAPVTVYGISKATGIHLCRLYRKEHGVFSAAGILYNHESKYRPERFVSKKIIAAAVRIKNGVQDKLFLGNLSAVVDWGYAPDYVVAMQKILSLDAPDDFVVATGKGHSVQEFVEYVFDAVQLDWKKHVVENKAILTRKSPVLIGNSAKLQRVTNWEPSINFQEMLKILVAQQMAAS